MPLIGERAETFLAVAGDNWYTVTWSAEIPPSAAFGKAFLGDLFIGNDVAGCTIGIMSYRRRLPDGSDQLITFPDLNQFDHVLRHFELNVTNFTFGVKVLNCVAYAFFTIGYWV